MTLGDLERLDARSTFSADLRTCTNTVLPRTTKFGVVTQMGIGIFQGVGHIRIQWGGDLRDRLFRPYLRPYTPIRFDPERPNSAR